MKSSIWNTDGVDFASLEAFVAVVDHAGFTRASSALHLSQPALSRRIGLLEGRLRQPLFERNRRGVRLTEAGQALLPHARAALASLRDGAAAVQAVRRGDTGAVAIGIVGTLASSGVVAQLGRFRAAHPGIRVLLRTGSSVEISGLVRRGEVALGIRYFADPAPDLVSRMLYREPFVVIAPAAHRLATGRRLPAERLRGEPWVAFPARRGAAADPFGQSIARALAAAGLDGGEIVVIDSLTAQKRLVEAGFGLALVPASSVHEELARGSLRTLDVPAVRAAIDVALVHRRGVFLSQAAQRLMDALGELQKETAERAVSSRQTRRKGRHRRP